MQSIQRIYAAAGRLGTRMRAPAARKVFSIAVLLVLAAGLTQGCQKTHPIVGLWRTNGPSNLLFDYREDGVVVLIEETQTFQMFHYQLQKNDTVFLYDGMGRRQVYRYQIDGDEMKYYLAGEPDEATYTFRREK